MMNLFLNLRTNPDVLPMHETKYPEVDGVYKHYKGGLYRVISMAQHTENQEKLVIYKSLLFGSIYARPLGVWNETVEVKDKIFIERFTHNDR